MRLLIHLVNQQENLVNLQEKKDNKDLVKPCHRVSAAELKQC